MKSLYTRTLQGFSHYGFSLRRFPAMAVLALLTLTVGTTFTMAAQGNPANAADQKAQGSQDSAANLEAEKRLPPASSAAGKKDETPNAKPAETTGSVSRDYILGEGDVLSIDVWKEPEITRNVPVRPDGKISLPLVGELVASGVTADVLQGEIAKSLGNYFRDPQVTVIVQEANSHKFNIIGNVGHPGVFPVTPNMTALDAMALAGGFRDFAKVKGIYVLRRMPDGSRKRIPFNYKAAVEGKAGYHDLEIQTGDTIVVP